ncbi:MAG TPA: hypothetical protein VD926_09145 [Acidimicrobiales bacterium]|nr:hypothetical protein [Acidimicrobiales bacterium]
MSLTVPPPSAEGAEPDDRRSAWYAASRRRLGLDEDIWYDPAVEHVLEALARRERIDAAVSELGSARGEAGFDLRETASDLDALAEVLPAEEAELADRATVAALSAWADAFIDRVHPPACVDAMTGLVTLAYLRVRLTEVYRECAANDVRAAEAYALVVTGPTVRPPTPLARLATRLRAGRCIRDWFPGGESACHLDDERVAILTPQHEHLSGQANGLALDLAGDGPARFHIEALPDDHQVAQRRLDELASVSARNDR